MTNRSELMTKSDTKKPDSADVAGGSDQGDAGKAAAEAGKSADEAARSLAAVEEAGRVASAAAAEATRAAAAAEASRRAAEVEASKASSIAQAQQTAVRVVVPDEMTKADAAKRVRRFVYGPVKTGKVDADGKDVMDIKLIDRLPVRENEVLDFKDFGTHVVVVTVDGQKFRSDAE
jgi:hypothetical protein